MSQSSGEVHVKISYDPDAKSGLNLDPKVLRNCLSELYSGAPAVQWTLTIHPAATFSKAAPPPQAGGDVQKPTVMIDVYYAITDSGWLKANLGKMQSTIKNYIFGGDSANDAPSLYLLLHEFERQDFY